MTLGDSLTHGFQSGAIFNTEISYPRIIAWELGWGDQFRDPRYGGPGGLPINIELLIRRLEQQFGDKVDWWELAHAAFSLRSIMDEIEDYWERGPGAQPPTLAGINHNLGMYGWDLRDAMSRTSAICRRAIVTPKDDWISQIVENASDRAALRVLPAYSGEGPGMSTVDAAEALGEDGGIETLIVFLGANNALGAVIDLEVTWSQAGASGEDYRDLQKKAAFTVWDPLHFKAELVELDRRIRAINAQHVIWGTVPHVTIAPLARGVGSKVRPDSRYFPYYTRPWIDDASFDPADDPHLTENEARAVDSAIDQYNDFIVAGVAQARREGHDWYLLDVAGILDRLASKRYIDSPAARPAWWRPYDLPPALAALSPRPNSWFFQSGPDGRQQGGLFSLDGVHPTTIAYGIVAQEFINVMQLAGVPFFFGDGRTLRPGSVKVDFQRLIALDTLIKDPPRSLSNDLRLVGWFDQKIDLFKRLF
ncbi:MAG TPA: hypothetical protein VMU50_20735 [Polyangia bacterium]|nr:hypothetical protein [Polyangia bacterium]